MFLKFGKLMFFLMCISSLICLNKCDTQLGPDPWNLVDKDLSNKIKDDSNVPPDLRMPPERKIQPESNLGSGEWFFRRILSIILKGGQIKKNDDNSMDISLQVRLDEKKWATLDELLKSTTALSDDMYRRSVGYVEEAIYRPTIADKIVMAWSDYVHIYMMEYKMHITWTLAISAISGALIWLWSRMSHRHFVIIIFLALYLYEVFVSYKEAEKQEIDRFLSAVNSCSWSFWSSTCEVPKPDPLIFLKHMNPLKIVIRMFTTMVSEPMISLSDTLKTMVHSMTDGLWYPFDKVVYGVLIITFNILLLFVLIMVVFNFILNIPFNLSFLGVSLGVMQRNRTLLSDTSSNHMPSVNSCDVNTDRISGATLDRLLDVFSRALPATQNSASNVHRPARSITNNINGIRRSASTGRLAQLSSSSFEANIENVTRRRNRVDGSGDAH